jgi:hypothetical protein
MAIKERETREDHVTGRSASTAHATVDGAVHASQESVTRQTRPAPPPAAQFFTQLGGMCVAMCAGGAILSLVFFGGASLIGQPNLDRQYPELSILVAAVSMSVAMTAWMVWQHHPTRHSVEMSGATLAVGVLLSSAFWLGIFPESSLTGWFTAHAFLCLPACLAMVVVMLLHLDHYTGTAHRAPRAA